MKIIITGGAGFIGSNIVDAYIKHGHRVAVIDNLSTGFRKNVNKKAKFYEADINNAATIEKIFKMEKPEVVNHHAALASVIESISNPVETFQTNVIGTVNLLVSFGKYGVGNNKKFIFSSTGGALYGSPKKIPVDEKAALDPLSPYGFTKFLGEETIKFYARQLRFNYFIFRYPNVYGPRQNPKGEAGVVAIFGGLIKSGKHPTIFGDGTKMRDYVYVGDIVKANVSALTKVKNETMNLGSGTPTSDRKIFDLIAKELKFKKEPIYAAHREGEVYKTALHAELAAKKLGWHAEISLEKGIKKTIESLK